MTPETRRSILRYGIAIDLVILATGVGMLLPLSPVALIFTFIVAVALAAWKGGWKGGLTALGFSIVLLVAMFGSTVDVSRLVAFAAAAAFATAIIHAGTAPRVRLARVAEPVETPLANVVTFDRAMIEHDEVASRERQTIARGLERTAVAQLEELRRETQRQQEEQEAERRAAEAREREAQARREAEQARREAEERQRRDEEARLAAEREAREREQAARRAKSEEIQQRLASARAELDDEADAKIERELAELRSRAEAGLEGRLAAARADIERELEERLHRELDTIRAGAAQTFDEKLNGERAATEREIEERIAAERDALRKQLDERIAREREAEMAAINAAAADRLESERRAAEEEARRTIEEQIAAIHREAEEKIAAARRHAEEETARRVAEETARVKAHIPPKIAAPKPGLVDTIAGWFKRNPKPRSLNLTTKKVAGNTKGPKRRVSTAPPAKAKRPAPAPRVRKPRLLFLERRRGTADTIVPKARQRNIEVEVVERWIDAVDELFRFRPDAIFIDTEMSDFETVYRTVVEQNAKLPIVLTGRTSAGFVAPPEVRYATFSVRPYDLDHLAQIAAQAMDHPEQLLALQAAPRTTHVSRPAPAPAPAPAPVAPQRAPEPEPVVARAPEPPPIVTTRSAPSLEITPVVANATPSNDAYLVNCFSCRTTFDALDADWCSCLTKERTMVCTNCLTCFCKAPPAYKEKFWVAAPPKLFERKTAETRRQQSGLPANPAPDDVRRPLVLCVEDDEEIQAIVQRVCSNLEYGFVYATNGQDGLSLARLYRPNLILSDAFMPKLDGREMCRILKEDPLLVDTKMVVMTGLYTDTKYRSEAVKRFHVDDYIAKPVAITELINLLQRHLEGVPSMPQEDLHALHRAEIDQHLDEREEMMGVPLADLLDQAIADDPLEVDLEPEPVQKPAPKQSNNDEYEVACFNCSQTFDAVHAEWCRCVGRDNTLLCHHCGGCFCKAPATYKERFWMDAPPSLFERKLIGSKRSHGSGANPSRDEVKRPLIMLVEDDENVQLIVRTVVTSLGYGFIVGANGQEGLSLAREYNPELILSDAFMPKLDGREMCRLLKEDPSTARAKAIIMTGLYTDRKYRNEALDYFRVDDYVAKPLAVDDLIKLFKKHLPQEVGTSVH